MTRNSPLEQNHPALIGTSNVSGTYASRVGSYPCHLPYGIMKERCGNCRGWEVNDAQGKRYQLFFAARTDLDLQQSRPEKSFTQAPLSKRPAAALQAVFQDTRIRFTRRFWPPCSAQQRLNEGKRFDMPGFRPSGHYIREMQRFDFAGS